jgi:polyisoprenoid-binding protein YceI
MKRPFTAIALILLLVTASASRAATTFTVDGVHSTVGFGVDHLVISTVRGEFTGFSGTIVLDGDDPAKWEIRGTIRAASIATGDEKRDAHLKGPDFLDVEKFPEITFRSRKIRRAEDGYICSGEFTLHGVTRVVEVPFTLKGPIADPWGNDRIGIEASWTIDRRDYGLVWSQTLETGGLMVGNDVEIDLHVEAVHTPQE